MHEDIGRIHEAANPGEVSVTVISGQPTGDISFGNTSLGSIEGRSWNDANGNGIIDAGESGVNGRTIRLFDESGNEVAATVTADRDLDGNNQIDPETESGFYLFEQFGAGLFTLEEEVPTRSTASFPGREVAQEARDLDQQNNLRRTRSDFRNWGGLDERWILGDNGWYYVTPNGEVFRWNGSPRTALTGTLVATLNSDYWLNLERLSEAPVPGRHAVTVEDHSVTRNFGSSAGN